MKSSRKALESGIESDAREYAILRGWWVCKFAPIGQTGVPDRIFIRRGRVIFIEFKKNGEEPTIKQLKKHEEMRRYGAEVFWCDSLEQAKEILK